jgi:malonyl-CoA/methylmalonyl-CoA synthetase
MDLTFWALLERSFSACANRTALVFSRRSYSYGELSEAARRVASILQTRGVVPGERILLLTESKEPFLLAYLGSLYCGAVPLPVNPRSKLNEVLYYANDSAASLVVHDLDSGPVAQSLGNQSKSIRSLITADEILGASSFGSVRSHEPAPGDPALMLYSSGTTGEPKGVVHTQANLAKAVQAIAEAWRFGPEDVLANVLPLFHIHGLSFATNVNLITGSTMLIGDRFHPIETLDLIDQSTVFMGVPPYYYALLKRDEFRARAARWNRLRLVTCGSAPIRSDVLPDLESILGQPVINRYGMTECHVLTSLPLEGPWPHGAVGLPLSGVEVDVRADTGGTCAAGEVGGVWARGPNLFREYWGRPAATAECFDAQGWFDTGDVGLVDDRGYLTLVGRSKDLIIVGGFNVYPPVVERVVNECPGVRECVVVGVPDAMRGERVAVFVVADDRALDAKRVRSFCRERLSDYQCPAQVQIVAELPRNAMGKVVRRELAGLLSTGQP